MSWLESLIVGIKGLAVHKVRAALSMLGIIFGVASVVAVLSVIEGAKAEVIKQLRALGGNNIIVRAKTPSLDQLEAQRAPSPGLNAEEAAVLAAQCPLIEAYAPIRIVGAQVSVENRQIDCEVAGTTASFLDVSGYQLEEGRFLLPIDERDCRRVCVLESAIRREMFPHQPCIGRRVLIAHEYYTVVGVLRSKEISESKVKIVDIARLNRRIYIPLSCAQHRATQSFPGHELREVMFRAASPDLLRETANVIGTFYEEAHRASDVPENGRDYEVKIALDLFRQTQKTQLIFDIVMGSSAGISLLVGGIGIMNIMLANVTERRREIGIRRSVGAREVDILRQFIIEALGICLFGGLAGIGLGIGLTWGIAEFAKWKTLISIKGLVLSIVVSLTDGLIFGTYPAWKAAKMDPIEALRYE